MVFIDSTSVTEFHLFTKENWPELSQKYQSTEYSTSEVTVTFLFFDLFLLIIFIII